MSKINLSLYHVKEIGYPFVCGRFINKKGDEMQGFFMIDTGSTENFFNKDAVKFLDKSCKMEKTHSSSGINNLGEECKRVKVSIRLDEYNDEEVFSISENIDFKQIFGPNQIIGILGTSFLFNNKLVLDYEKERLYSISAEAAEEVPNGKTFNFSINYGLRTWGLPLMGFINGGDENEVFFAIADSGANSNHLGKRAFDYGTISSTIYEKQSGQTIGIGGTFQTSIADVTLSFLCNSNGDKWNRYETEDDFFICDDMEYISCLENEDAAPVSGLLGTPFMLKRKWIIDFAHALVYSNY